ncbi:MAG: c-type cytochrome [Parvularculaceae bacterium]|nr:c-type cytochrome [Parvularculaceae bacterium]
MKDPLFSNKLAAAALVTLLIAVGIPVVIHTFEVLAEGHHHDKHDEENPFHLAYIPYVELVGGGAAPVEEEKISLGCLLANADPARGEKGAKLCASCHSLEAGGGNGTGPALWNLLDRAVGSVDGYGYTAALQGYDGAWSYEELDGYLYDSAAYINGTAMNQKIRKDNKRADILAYLGTLRDGGAAPYPVCEPPVEAAPAG